MVVGGVGGLSRGDVVVDGCGVLGQWSWRVLLVVGVVGGVDSAESPDWAADLLVVVPFGGSYVFLPPEFCQKSSP